MALPLRRRSRRSRGQALVEFALVLPVFLLILFGIIDAGRLIYTYNTIANAARDGARVAIVNQTVNGTNTCDTTSPTAGPIGCAIESGINLSVAPSDVQVVYHDWTDTTACNPLLIGCLAEVTVTGHYQALTPIIGQVIGPVTLTSTTKIPVERVCSNPPPSPLTNC
jgi:Flp pilus assembly protein TadG